MVPEYIVTGPSQGNDAEVCSRPRKYFCAISDFKWIKHAIAGSMKIHREEADLHLFARTVNSYRRWTYFTWTQTAAFVSELSALKYWFVLAWWIASDDFGILVTRRFWQADYSTILLGRFMTGSISQLETHVNAFFPMFLSFMLCFLWRTYAVDGLLITIAFWESVYNFLCIWNFKYNRCCCFVDSAEELSKITWIIFCGSNQNGDRSILKKSLYRELILISQS